MRIVRKNPLDSICRTSDVHLKRRGNAYRQPYFWGSHETSRRWGRWDVSTLPFVAEQRVVLDNISWSTYLAILHDAKGRRGRITFDNGVLEIMSPSKLHEKIKTLIARMLETFTEERRVACDSAGSATFLRADLQRAFEPDEGYHFANAAVVRGKDEIDLSVDPPPDLVIEVDISRSSLPKLGLHRALGSPKSGATGMTVCSCFSW